MLQPAEVADSLLFLLSRSASAITGQTIVLDGGVHVAWRYPEL
ncbi:SDR family oxidoreductase [Rhodococcus sp. JVH1]|nr:hypothetical protein JVH1_1091 [Rhodococcus sp. JVH1]